MILDLLSHYHQRATYGAVGSILDIPAAFVMRGCPRDARHSWIVNKDTGHPTGYVPAECDPHLHERDTVLVTAEDLQVWLNDPN